MLRTVGILPYFTAQNVLDVQGPRNPFAQRNKQAVQSGISPNLLLSRSQPETNPLRQGLQMPQQAVRDSLQHAPSRSHTAPVLTGERNPLAGHPRNWPKVWPGNAVPPIKEDKLTEKQSQDFLKELNAYRAKHGLKPVKLNPQLCQAADKHSLYQTSLNSCNHYGPRGPMHWFTGRAKAAGYTGQPVSENVAAGQKSVKEALWGWHMSPGHRRALLDPKITEIGIGFRRGKKGPYGGERWTFVSGRGSRDPDRDPENRRQR